MGGRLDFSTLPGALPPDWAKTGHAPAGAFMQWYGGSGGGQKTASAGSGERRTGKKNAESGTCPILGHRYRSIMERRFGLYLRYLGYERWTGEGDPPSGRWYAYERRDWEFPGIKGTNYHYTADYECWPALPDPDRPGAPILPYLVYEVKGWMDAASNTKLKRMAKFYPEIPLVVVDSRVFDLYTHGAENVVPGWFDRPGKERNR